MKSLDDERREPPRPAESTANERTLDYSGLTLLDSLRGDVLARARRRRLMIVPILCKNTLTIAALARACDLQKNTIKSFLDGETINMSAENREILALRLGFMIDELPK